MNYLRENKCLIIKHNNFILNCKLYYKFLAKNRVEKRSSSVRPTWNIKSRWPSYYPQPRRFMRMSPLIGEISASTRARYLKAKSSSPLYLFHPLPPLSFYLRVALCPIYWLAFSAHFLRWRKKREQREDQLAEGKTIIFMPTLIVGRRAILIPSTTRVKLLASKRETVRRALHQTPLSHLFSFPFVCWVFALSPPSFCFFLITLVSSNNYKTALLD